MTIEVKAEELKVGDVIVAKQGGRRYEVVEVCSGMGGPRYPYLVLKQSDGEKAEHDTAFDSLSATYTVEKKENT